MFFFSAAASTLSVFAALSNCHSLPNVDGTFGDSPAPFTLNVDSDFIAATKARVALARPPIEIEGVDPQGSDGPPLDNFTTLRDYWTDDYDWFAVQEKINRKFQQFTTTVKIPDSDYPRPVPLHFVHHTSQRSDAIPLLFVHGWPGSFLEVENIIDTLTNPPDASNPAFHVVAPSIPGFGFSPAPTVTGFGPAEAGHSFNALMRQLGYDKYVAQAGDLGGIITRYQASLFPDNLVSLLSNFWLITPNATDLERYAAGETSADENTYIGRITNYVTQNSGYRYIQATFPLTVSYGLNDSPLGFALWIYSLMRTAVDPRVTTWTPEEIITWSMMYTIQGPYGAARMYKEIEAAQPPVDSPLDVGVFPFVEVPVGLSLYPYDLWYGLPLEWAQREGNVQERFVNARGGHFAAWEVPQIMAGDIWEWFGNRTLSGTDVFFDRE